MPVYRESTGLGSPLTALVRVIFMLRTLEVLKRDFGERDIPLIVETVEERRNIPAFIEEMIQEWGAKHLSANTEYEVDKLRRKTHIVRSFAEKGKSFDVLLDTCVVSPGELTSGSCKQYSVYTPWVPHIHSSPETLSLFPAPERNRVPQDIISRSRLSVRFQKP